MIFPSASIIINNDLVPQVQSHIERQLHITTTLDGYQFDSALFADHNYLLNIHLNRQRLLVIRNFQEYNNRSLFDVVIFVKDGMAAVEINNFGPHGFTFPIVNLSWKQLGFY